ncbi:MAG: response regulator [Chloroflexi bacterium]|nr:response regulator [Chloroflexota bacterium]MBU1661701.1 response regulator [Chloroflexota bacterium]
MRKSSPQVLVIDDDRDTLDLLKLALERNGFSVITAASWEEVGNQIDRTFQRDRAIDVIVLDLMMPERSGFDILLSLQVALAPMPPVIVLSAITGLEQQIKARNLGATKYMTKPTTPQKLIEAVKTVLADARK